MRRATNQCATCSYIVLSDKNKWLCWKDSNKKQMDVIQLHDCDKYKLGAMHQVYRRGVVIKDGLAIMK